MLDEGLEYISEGLSFNTTIKHIYLSGNGIGLKGIKKLCE